MHFGLKWNNGKVSEVNEDTVLECVGNEAIAAVSMLNTMIYCFHHPGPHSNGQDIHQELTMD